MRRELTRHLAASVEEAKEYSTGPIMSNPQSEGTLQSALQAERSRIAAALHDQVLQTFGLCVLKAQVCDKLLQQAQYGRASAELAVLQERLNQAIDEVRQILSGLKQSGPE